MPAQDQARSSLPRGKWGHRKRLTISTTQSRWDRTLIPGIHSCQSRRKLKTWIFKSLTDLRLKYVVVRSGNYFLSVLKNTHTHHMHDSCKTESSLGQTETTGLHVCSLLFCNHIEQEHTLKEPCSNSVTHTALQLVIKTIGIPTAKNYLFISIRVS